MHIRGGDAVTTRAHYVYNNNSAYTSVATPQDIDQMIYIQGIRPVFLLHSLLWGGLFLPHLIRRQQQF